MKTYKAQGIVLHTIKYGESSLVAYVLTDTIGRESYMIQGVRSKKSHNSKNAFFQPMFLVDFVGIESEHASMHRMKDIQLSQPLKSLPFDVRKSTIALFMAEVLYRLVRETEPNSPLFDFVKRSVLSLDQMQSGVANFHLWFLVRMSAFLGFYPSNEYSPHSWFDIVEGGFTPIRPQHNLMLSQENALLLHRLMNIDAELLPELALSRHQRNDFLSSLLVYFGYHLDTINNIRSLKILSEVF